MSRSIHSVPPARSSHLLRRSLIAAALGLGALLLPLAPASAHDALVSTSPATGATVSTAPTTVSLTFEEPPTKLGLAMAMTDPSGATVAVGPPVLTGSVVSATVPSLAAQGTYTVAWRIVADVGHPLTGTFTFVLASSPSPSTPSVTATATNAPAPSDDGGNSVAWVAVIVVALVAAIVAAVFMRRRRTS